MKYIVIVSLVYVSIACCMQPSTADEEVSLFVDTQENLVKKLHRAAHIGDVEQLHDAIRKGADLASLNPEGRIALYHAIAAEKPKAVEVLVAHGMNVNAKDFMGDRPLHIAATVGNCRLIEYLLNKGADHTVRNQEGATPLHIAVLAGKKDAALCLLQNGADINAQNNFGETPLHIAASERNFDMIKLLTKKGADYSLVDLTGKTARDHIRLPTHQEKYDRYVKRKVRFSFDN